MLLCADKTRAFSLKCCVAVYVLLGSELNSRVFQTRVLKIRNSAYSNSSLHLCHSREPPLNLMGLLIEICVFSDCMRYILVFHVKEVKGAL